MQMYDNILLKNYMREKRYLECIAILKKKIIEHVIKQIKSKDDSVSYTTISDLINLSDYYLNNSEIARSLQIALEQETQLERIQYLLLICEENNIK